LSRSLSVALALACLAAPARARADAILDVSGAVVATSPRLAVRVSITNRGDLAAGPIDVVGELAGASRSARLAGTLAPGASGDVALEFERAPSQPGLHALTLLLEHPVAGPPDAAGNPPTTSERAWLLLAFGESATEAVRMRAEPLQLDVRGTLVVRLESRDAQPAQVWLRALTARGLTAAGRPIEVAVPAHGETRALLPLVRAGAVRGTHQAVLLVAETPQAPVSRTSVAVAAVEVTADPALFPKWRAPVFGLGLLLIALALGYEAWKQARPRASDPA
jgi:hypothetical protein